jgi:hypothetical protein
MVYKIIFAYLKGTGKRAGRGRRRRCINFDHIKSDRIKTDRIKSITDQFN